MHLLFQRDRPELFYTKSRVKLADKEWQSLCTEIDNSINTATPDKRKKLLCASPKFKAKGYVQEKESGRFQTRIYAFGKIRSIGTFSNEHEATFAYLMATTMVQSATSVEPKKRKYRKRKSSRAIHSHGKITDDGQNNEE